MPSPSCSKKENSKQILELVTQVLVSSLSNEIQQSPSLLVFVSMLSQILYNLIENDDHAYIKNRVHYILSAHAIFMVTEQSNGTVPDGEKNTN